MTFAILLSDAFAAFHWQTLLIAMGWLIASAAALEKIYNWIFGGTGKRIEKVEAAIGQFVDKDALEKRFATIEERQSKQASEIVNQHNTLMEYLRERERLSGIIGNRLNLLEEKVHVFEVVPSRVDKLETKLDNLTTQISDLKNGQRDLRNELREDMRSNKGEILEAIKSLR